MLTQIDFDKIVARLNSEIREAVARHIAQRRKVTAPAKYAKQRLSGVRRERLEDRTSELSAKLDRAERYQTERHQSVSGTAATIAAQTTQHKRSEGKRVTFAAEHRRIMAELLENPAAARTRYSRELAKAAQPTPRYQLELSNGRPTQNSFIPVRQRAAEIAQRRCGGDPSRMNAEVRKAISEIFQAAADKMTGFAATALYGRDPEDGQLFSEAYGSISTRASEMARRRALAGKGSFMECYRAAIEQLHRECATS